MKIVAKTDIGRKRRSNQDSYASGELPGGVAWAVVCDGMGGENGGDVASVTAVRIISERIIDSYDGTMSESSIKKMLIDAINEANTRIYDMSCSVSSLSGMGTTVVAVIMESEKVYIAHAGDSRAYSIKNGTLHQLTRDHSIVQEMVESGEITLEQAANHPNKNIITRAVGAEDEIEVDFCSEKTEEGDCILICTDGLTNFVSDDDILYTIANYEYYDTAEHLVQMANNSGGGDNITVVLILR